MSEPRFWLDAVLGSYSQILFTRSRGVAVLLVAATFVSLPSALLGLGAALLGGLVARLLRFSPDSIRAGLFGYNALLVGLGLGALFQLTPALVALAVVATFVTVVATATLNAALGSTFNLPSLTLPFLLVFYLVWSFAGELKGITPVPLGYDPTLLGEHLPHMLASYLKALGAIFFLPRTDAGLLVLAALLLFSRIGFTLSLLGFAVAYPLTLHMVLVPDAQLHLMMGYNLMLVAIALGGVWFVPRPTSFLFAAGGVLVGAAVTLGTRTLLGRVGLPLLITPFNLTVIPMLYAMRMRVRDGAPKAVDFWMGTPEQNLNYFQTRMARFGALYHVRFGLPFLGKWTCTQGVDGPHTHQGPWRHGFDFEVADSEGRTHRGTGRLLPDYLCYRLPVLASADGTVVKVVDGIPDNDVGELNTRDNWGNLVLIYHGPGLYSLVAHLAPESIRVREGEIVRRGAQIGQCGNSGRSPTPHVHFQLQATDRIGAPTIESAFHEIVVMDSAEEELHATYVPEQGDTVRNLVRDDDLARLFQFPIGEESRLAGEGNAPETRAEEVTSVIDLYGNLSLRNKSGSAHLFFETRHGTFTVYDYTGPSSSPLSLVNVAIPRVPFDKGRNLTWTDHLVSRYFFPWGIRVLRDFVAPFLGLGGLRMRYRMARIGPHLTIAGESLRKGRDGRPVMTTRAEARDGVGLEGIEVVLNGRTRRVRRQAAAEKGAEAKEN